MTFARVCALLKLVHPQADTSGTAKALVASFQQLGLKFEVDEIEKVRTPEAQLKMGVPGA